MNAVTEAELTPIRRLLVVARSDTGQAHRVANFLLAWWNATDCGGFDLTEFWSLDPTIRDDMLLTLEFIALHPNYPDHYGLGDDFAAVVALWRPDVGRPAPWPTLATRRPGRDGRRDGGERSGPRSVSTRPFRRDARGVLRAGILLHAETAIITHRPSPRRHSGSRYGIDFYKKARCSRPGQPSSRPFWIAPASARPPLPGSLG
jgi:hypothetical protein